MRLKITTKTTIIYSLIFLVISISTAIFVTGSLNVSVMRNAADTLEGYYAVVEEYVKNGDSELVNTLSVDVIVADAGGAVMAANTNNDDFRTQYSFSERFVLSGDKIIVGKALPGGIMIYLRTGVADELAAVGTARLTFAVMTLAGLTVMAALGSIASSGMLKPIVQMNNTIKSISIETLGTRIETNSTQDELNGLKDNLNVMLDELEAGFLAQARFVSDASHELRTPISVVQGYANLLRRWGKNEPQMLDEAITAIAAEAENMKNMVDKLLFLAKADKLTLKREPFVLSEVVEEIVKETRMIAADREILIGVVEPLEFEGDKALVKQALRVFVDNAVKYTGDDGIIRVGLESNGDGKLRVRIDDNGIGIPEVDLPHIFERFYRCDVARARQKGSTGLGLSIAKTIIDAHGGEIIIDSVVGKGTRITVLLDEYTEDDEEF